MGVYLTTPSHAKDVKVSGALADILNAREKPHGQMSAEDFLVLLDREEQSLTSTAQWRELVASGSKSMLDSAAATVGLAFCVSDPRTRLWLDHRKLQFARDLAMSAVASNDCVSWA